MTIPEKQEAWKRLVANPDFQVFFYELDKMADDAMKKQLDCNPLTEGAKAMEYKIFRTVVAVVIPDRIQAFINYQEDAPDKQVEPKKQWKFSDFLASIKQMFQNSPPVA